MTVNVVVTTFTGVRTASTCERSEAMRRGFQWALLGGMGVCFIAIATADVWGSPTRGFREGWGCEPGRIGITILSLEEGGGSSDELQAVRDLLPSLAANSWSMG
jgi:hypothetical protein